MDVTFIGQTISNFKILAKIAENATGTLYGAIDTESHRLTLKVLSPGAAANPEFRTLLDRAPVNTMDLFVASGQILVGLGNQMGNIWSVKVSE